MSNNYEQLAQLIVKYLRQDLNEAELGSLNDWLAKHPKNQRFFESLKDNRHLQQKLHAYHEIDRDRIWTLTRERLSENGYTYNLNPTRFIRRWLPYAAALLLGVIGVAWFFFDQQSPDNAEIIRVQATDIQPGSSRATLTLADGKTIVLDEDKDGIVVSGSKISYNDGAPIVDVEGKEGDEILELTTPRGGTYQITLADGTKVWLNSETKLKYPNNFDATERVVHLEGEAYFEVSSLPLMEEGGKLHAYLPFKVKNGSQMVDVLGTEFNISAYAEDVDSKTTLVGGSVRVIPTAFGASPMTIKPGQQAVVRGTNISINSVDVQQYIAWKDGLFYFNKTSFDDMIRLIGRWYDIDVEYEGEMPSETFTGKMERNLSLMTMLNILDISDSDIRLEGNKLIVRNLEEEK